MLILSLSLKKYTVLKVRLSRNDLNTFYEMTLSSKIRTNCVRSVSLYKLGMFATATPDVVNNGVK